MELTMTMAPEIRAMFSPEGERVEVLKVKATGNVEDWLKQVEKNMITAVRACIKKAKDDFEKSVREDWLVRHPHQVRCRVLDHRCVDDRSYPFVSECPHGLADLLVFGSDSHSDERRNCATTEIGRIRKNELPEFE